MEKPDDNSDRFQISELFMAKADYHRKFIGEINRHTNLDGNKFVTGKVFVQDGYIWSMAGDQFELSINLDEICNLKLDYALHDNTGVVYTIMDERFFLN
jgi:hypothetical protein